MQCSFVKANLLNILLPLFCLSLVPIYNITFFNIYSISDVENCPFCLGKSICSCFINESFVLDWNYFWSNLLNVGFKNLQREKTVLFGKIDKKQVVIKKISNVKDTKSNGNISLKNILKKLNPILRTNSNTFYKFNVCPSHERFELLIEALNIHTEDPTVLNSNLEYMLKINIEPIIQQVSRVYYQILFFLIVGLGLFSFVIVI